MKIVPTTIEQHINRVDRTRSLMVGISAGLIALWSLYRVLWSLYLAITYNLLFGSLVFQIVLWGVIGAAAATTATGFLTHFAKPTTGNARNQP